MRQKKLCLDGHFNPRSRVGNDEIWLRFIFLIQFQSTFPRGERQHEISAYIQPQKISIHVPARGTTPADAQLAVCPCISIHVPAWGTTKNTWSKIVDHIFQSTFPRGERPLPRYEYCRTSRISIHVPAWGTTVYNRSRHSIRVHFNPRSRVGNDFCIFASVFLFTISIHVPAWGTTQCFSHQFPVFQFQSTFPRGERHQRFHFWKFCCLFQSTFPRGERH